MMWEFLFSYYQIAFRYSKINWKIAILFISGYIEKAADAFALFHLFWTLALQVPALVDLQLQLETKNQNEDSFPTVSVITFSKN